MRKLILHIPHSSTNIPFFDGCHCLANSGLVAAKEFDFTTFKFSQTGQFLP